MTAEIFAEWLRRQGLRVLQTTSADWVELGPRVFQAVPYHAQIDPSQAELEQLLRDRKVLALRYSTRADRQEGMPSYHVVRQPGPYCLEMLSKKARYDIRRGLAVSTTGPLSLEELADQGWELRRDTLARQGRQAAESDQDWRSLCLSAVGLPGFEAWGTWSDGKLAASLLAFTCDDCVSILYQQSRTRFLASSVNHALTFTFTQAALQRPGRPWLFYGLQSLDAPASVDEFKFRLGYTARPVRQRVVFHPWLGPLATRSSHSLLSWAQRRMPGNPTLAKAEGMVRFYLQGNVEG